MNSDSDEPAVSTGVDPGARPAYRAPIGIPTRPDADRPATVVSVLLHALLIGLLIFPLFAPKIGEAITGGGGPGPAGGGGGGTGGTGGAQAPKPLQERLRYIEVVPTPVPTPSVLPPIEEKKEEEKEKPLDIKIEETKLDVPVDMALEAGTGGGSGRDGTTGSGPGSGGGVGSGVGTGRGTGAGPGTGGGDGVIYPPKPKFLVLPPYPIPAKVRGTLVIARFDVDSTGKVLNYTFNETSDRGYNRKLRDAIKAVQFDPALRADNLRPVRAVGQVTFELH